MGACSKSTKFARRRPFPCPSPDAQRLGPNAWQPIQHQVRRKKKIIRAQRQALNVASEHNFWNPLVHSRSRDRGNPESNQVTEGSRRGNPACSGGRGLVLGCGKPMPQRQASQAIPPSGAPLPPTSLRRSPRPTPRFSPDNREAHHFRGHLSTSNRQLLTATQRNEEEEV